MTALGFFATFWTWLNTQLATYIGENTVRVAAALEPAILVGATLYVMIWGYLQMTGQIGEPFVAGLQRIVLLAVVLAVSLRLWLYHTVVVTTFLEAPAQLTAAVVGAPDAVTTVDRIWERGGTVASLLWEKGGIFNGDVGYYIAGTLVWLFMGLLCIYVMFLLTLSSIALSVLLALGPFFFGMLLFASTRRFFDAWLAQLANYALITILAVMVAALLLQVVESFATQTAALGADLVTVDAINMVLLAMLSLLLMRQVMPIAAALAGGMALSSHGLVSQAAGRMLTTASTFGRFSAGYALSRLRPGVAPAVLPRAANGGVPSQATWRLIGPRRSENS